MAQILCLFLKDGFHYLIYYIRKEEKLLKQAIYTFVLKIFKLNDIIVRFIFFIFIIYIK